MHRACVKLRQRIVSQWLARLLDKVACGSLDWFLWFVVSIPSTLGVRASGSKSASAIADGRLIKQAGEPF